MIRTSFCFEICVLQTRRLDLAEEVLPKGFNLGCTLECGRLIQNRNDKVNINSLRRYERMVNPLRIALTFCAGKSRAQKSPIATTLLSACHRTVANF
jgi:hypothetical protein